MFINFTCQHKPLSMQNVADDLLTCLTCLPPSLGVFMLNKATGFVAIPHFYVFC